MHKVHRCMGPMIQAARSLVVMMRAPAMRASYDERSEELFPHHESV
jgi:hypothetical protein